jgi:hypothetical protein
MKKQWKLPLLHCFRKKNWALILETCTHLSTIELAFGQTQQNTWEEAALQITSSTLAQRQIVKCFSIDGAHGKRRKEGRDGSNWMNSTAETAHGTSKQQINEFKSSNIAHTWKEMDEMETE